MKQEIRFGTDGWRAIIAKEFTVENVARLSFGLSHWVRTSGLPKSVVIGHDCRFAGELFCKAAAAVLHHEGIEVLMSDRIVTTPMLAMAARDLNCAAGIMMTASHNPPAYNGFKLKTHLGGPMGGEALRQIEKAVPQYVSESLYAGAKEDYRLCDIESPYAEAIEKNFDMASIRARSSSLAYDAMYGSGQFVMRNLLPDILHFRCEHDPNFAGISPEPIARNLEAFAQRLQLENEVEIGLVNDGDADRIGLMDGDGSFIDSHHIILLLIHYLVHYKGLKGKVVTAFSTVNKVAQLCAHYGLDLQIVKIGFKYASEVMVQEPVMLAGEESGGISVQGHIPERDGIWMGLMLMEFMAETGKDINALIQEVYDIVGSFVFRRSDLALPQEQKDKMVAACRGGKIDSIAGRSVQRVEDLDGWKFILDEDSWVMIRPSGTEPVLRIYVEASTEQEAEQLLSGVDELIAAQA